MFTRDVSALLAQLQPKQPVNSSKDKHPGKGRDTDTTGTSAPARQPGTGASTGAGQTAAGQAAQVAEDDSGHPTTAADGTHADASASANRAAAAGQDTGAPGQGCVPGRQSAGGSSQGGGHGGEKPVAERDDGARDNAGSGEEGGRGGTYDARSVPSTAPAEEQQAMAQV